jgi:DNA-binding MarR family transcriptional regulator
MTESKYSDLALLVDAVHRIRGRLREPFQAAHEKTGLSDMEITVLTAVFEAQHPPTVPRIGRSLGHSRQVIQRAANALIEQGLISLQDNPDHKRASLLVITEKGSAMKRASRSETDKIAADILSAIDTDAVRQATTLLNGIRSQLEAHIRKEPT